MENVNIPKDVLVALLSSAYGAGFHRAAKDGMCGFNPRHVERCFIDGVELAKEIAESAGKLWPSRT